MIVLFRKGEDLRPEEVEAAQKYFPLTYSRCEVMGHRVIIPRYSCLPFFKELEHDVQLHGARLLNSYIEHSYVANFDWYYDLEEFTPKTWFRLHEVDRSKAPYVLKGRTNSRKARWKEMMYAPTWERAVQINIDLMNDPLIGQQEVIARQFESFVTYTEALNGQPVTNEWRVFCYGGEILAYGYYWSSYEEFAPRGRGSFEAGGLELVRKVVPLLSSAVQFYVVDVAERQDGVWRVVEINDGQMSGLSMVDPTVLYRRLRECTRDLDPLDLREDGE